MVAIRQCLLALVLAVVSGASSSATPAPAEPAESAYEYTAFACGPLENAYGPFDYRTATHDERRLVEAFHYDPAMQGLRRGEMMNERGFIWNDFDYTLRAFPNHPGSLQGVDQLARLLKSDKPPRAARSALCYFLRATAFRPDDAVVRLLYGLYLLRRDRSALAIEQLKMADELLPDDMNVQYNLGLAYFRLKDYDKALFHAQRAYARGAQLPGLERMLRNVGKWPKS